MVYDCFGFFNELDLLEIRLSILDPYVDHFVLCESLQTFSGHDKSLYYQDNKERFSKWNHKIIHLIAPSVETDNVFERTALQKDFIREALVECGPDDIIYYGDVDEIWIPQEVGDEIYKLEQLNYCYYLNQRSSELWQGTNVCKYKNLLNLNEFRANHDHVLPNGGWHFTNMGGLDQIRKKIAAYDHQEMINDDVRDNLEERMKNGEDYLGRRSDWKGKPFEFWVDESDLPEYLQENKNTWIKLFR